MKNLNKLTLLVFTAEWCSGCSVLKASLNDESFNDLHIQYLDIDEVDQDFTKSYNIRSLPTGVILNEGQEVYRFTGGKTVKALQDILAQFNEETVDVT